MKSNYSFDFKQINDYAQLLDELNSKCKRPLTKNELQGHEGCESKLYPKRLKAKDASMYDDKSLSEILGTVLPDEKPIPVKNIDENIAHGVQTIKSSLCMSEYFEMCKKKKILNVDNSITTDSKTRENIESEQLISDVTRNITLGMF